MKTQTFKDSKYIYDIYIYIIYTLYIIYTIYIYIYILTENE